MIMHFRVVPGFWVAVEEVRRPEFRSCPLILGGLPHQRGVVREANFPAQHRGVRAGMSLSQAHQHCPEGIFLMPDLSHYGVIWETICDILRIYTPLVEPLEMGQAVSDLSGCERLWGNGLEVARTISSHVHHSTGILPWLGIASSRLVAQLASTVVGPEGITVIGGGQEMTFLAGLPLTLLPEIDPRLALTFQVLGLTTIGQFAALPIASVKQRFGDLGERLHAYARGIDSRPVVPPPSDPSIAARYECDEGSIEEAATALQTLADTCAAELQHRGLAGTVVELTLEWSSPPSSPPAPPPTSTAGKLQEKEVHQVSTNRDSDMDTLPIPYRIHSMLPQPGATPTPTTSPSAHNPVPILPGDPHYPPVPSSSDAISRGKSTVRTPVDTVPQVLAPAHRLLLQHWSKDRRRRLHAMELTISQFPAPKQLSFIDFGGLRGASAERLQALAEQEHVLATRYGDASFRHVTGLDPGNVLTERRFRWRSGLPWGLS